MSISYSGASYGGLESKEIRREGLRETTDTSLKMTAGQAKVEKENPQEKKNQPKLTKICTGPIGEAEKREREKRVGSPGN